jgi:hypothetical protein
MAIVIEYQLTGIEVLTRIQVVNALKAALRSLGEYWHEAFAWKRFTPLGYSEYGFRPRTLKYDRAKQRHLGHTNPLLGSGKRKGVFIGHGRDELLSESTKTRIRVTRDSVTIPMPRKFNQYNPKGPNMSEEVRTVSTGELRQLEENLVLYIEEELDRAVPVHLRNRGEIGGRVESLELKTFRPFRTFSPAQRRAAA